MKKPNFVRDGNGKVIGVAMPDSLTVIPLPPNELRQPCAKCSHVHIALACPTTPPDPESDAICDNEKRAAWGLEAVETYAARTGLDISPSADGVETAISDLLADLQHVADREGLDFADMVERARNHYEAETAEGEATERETFTMRHGDKKHPWGGGTP